MQTDHLRDSLIHQAESAMLTMMRQVNILLEAAQLYASLHPATSSTVRMKHTELKQSVSDLGSIPRMLVDEVNRWKNGEERVLGRPGIETFLLADLYASMDSMYWFFIREGIDVAAFSLDEVKKAHYEMIRCNRLL
jgi:hypothetical protein